MPVRSRRLIIFCAALVAALGSVLPAQTPQKPANGSPSAAFGSFGAFRSSAATNLPRQGQPRSRRRVGQRPQQRRRSRICRPSDFLVKEDGVAPDRRDGSVRETERPGARRSKGIDRHSIARARRSRSRARGRTALRALSRRLSRRQVAADHDSAAADAEGICREARPVRSGGGRRSAHAAHAHPLHAQQAANCWRRCPSSKAAAASSSR